MPHIQKAELIEGVVHMPAAVRWNQHAGPHADLITWLGVYRAYTPGVRAGDSGTMRMDLDNEPQPDAALVVEPSHGGQVRLSEDDYIEGAPELAAEIAASSVSIDLNSKFRVYRRNNVREYIVWRVQDREIDWFVLRNTEYERLTRDAEGTYRSAVFPGLWLAVPRMIEGDLAAVLQVLQHGLNTSEHAAYVEKLRNSKRA